MSFLSRKKDTPTFVSLYLSKRCNVFILFLCLLWEINLLTSWHSPIRFWWQISQDARKYLNIVAGHTYRKYVYHLSFVYFFTWIRIKGKFKVREKLGRGKFLKRNITKLLPPLPNVHEDSSTWPPFSQPRPREKLPVSVLEIFLFLRQSGNSLRQSCSLIYIYLPSRTINLSLPVLVEKRIIYLVEDNAFNLIDMFIRNEFFDKISVHFFFFFGAISRFDEQTFTQ